MAASERARNLAMACRGTAQMVGVRAEQGDEDWLLLAIDRQEQAEAALLAYVARLEACVATARVMANAVYAPSLTNDVKAALAALDRPEDGESK